jgi:Holliday junction resolvase-like predicted endonuclease
MTDNILFVHDTYPVEYRERSSLWYDGARNIVDRVFKRHIIMHLKLWLR